MRRVSLECALDSDGGAFGLQEQASKFESSQIDIDSNWIACDPTAPKNTAAVRRKVRAQASRYSAEDRKATIASRIR